MNDYTPKPPLIEPPLDDEDTQSGATAEPTWPPPLDQFPDPYPCPTCNGNGCQYCAFSGYDLGDLT